MTIEQQIGLVFLPVLPFFVIAVFNRFLVARDERRYARKQELARSAAADNSYWFDPTIFDAEHLCDYPDHSDSCTCDD